MDPTTSCDIEKLRFLPLNRDSIAERTSASFRSSVTGELSSSAAKATEQIIPTTRATTINKAMYLIDILKASCDAAQHFIFCKLPAYL